MTMDNGRSPDGSGHSAEPEPCFTVSAQGASVPNAGEVYRIVYPFVRDTYSAWDEEGGYEAPTWKPGVRFEWVAPDDTADVADALGEAIFTVEAVFKPGRFPTRVFYTRQFVNPDGKQFGKGKLHIATLTKFRALVKGYRHPFGVGEPLHRPGTAQARIEFERFLREAAIAMEARQGRDVKQAPSQSDDSAGRKASPTTPNPSTDTRIPGEGK